MTIETKVQEWAKAKNINQRAPQANKVGEEIGELTKNILILISRGGQATEENQRELADAVGDIQVTLIILAMILDVDYSATTSLAPYKRDITKPEEFDLLQTMRLSMMLADSYGDLLTAMGKGWTDKLNVAFGKTQALLKMNAQNLGIDYDLALQNAYEVIITRSGEMRDGLFVKSEDLHK